jgi:hypothetical protein
MFYVYNINLAFTNIFNKTTHIILKKEFENRKIISSVDRLNDEDIVVRNDNVKIINIEDITNKEHENRASIVIQTYESIK